jgi:hypothetical protein
LLLLNNSLKLHTNEVHKTSKFKSQESQLNKLKTVLLKSFKNEASESGLMDKEFSLQIEAEGK